MKATWHVDTIAMEGCVRMLPWRRRRRAEGAFGRARRRHRPASGASLAQRARAREGGETGLSTIYTDNRRQPIDRKESIR